MIVITGGAGFLGSNLLKTLEERGHHDLVVCDRLGETEQWRNLSKREIADMIPPRELMLYLETYADQIDAVVHLGGIHDSTALDAGAIVTENFRLSRRLWKWCAETKTRFLYASSGATYGDGEHGFDDEDTSPEGLAKYHPQHPYGWSKHLFDRTVARIVASGAAAQIPPQWVGFKFFTVYGPNEYHRGKNCSLAYQLYPKIKAGARVELFKSHKPNYEDGEQKRDFTYVEDCVKVMAWFLENPDKSGLFNVGTGEARSYRALAMATFDALGKPAHIKYVDMPESMKDRYQYFTEAKIAKLRQAGYKDPFLTLEEGIERYVHTYLETKDPYA